MKKAITTLFFRLIIITFCAFFITDYSYAQKTTATPAPTKKVDTNPSNQDQINNLKDRIASRVAQLKLTEKRGIIGTVAEVSETTRLSIVDINGNTQLVDIDELTKFSSPSAKEGFGISDITKGTKISVLGLYNKQSQRIFARFIDVITYPTRLYGVVLSIDNTNYTLTLTTESSKKITVDVESLTKTSIYTKDGGLIKGGFSKIKEGDNVFLVVVKNLKDTTRFSALRIINFPDLSKNPTTTTRVVSPAQQLKAKPTP